MFSPGDVLPTLDAAKAVVLVGIELARTATIPTVDKAILTQSFSRVAIRGGFWNNRGFVLLNFVNDIWRLS